MEENRKRQRIYRTIMLIFVVALITFITTTALIYNGQMKYATVSGSKLNNSTIKKLDTLLETVKELLEEKYVGEVNEEELIDGALKGLVASVGDRYTEYYTKEELEDFTAQTLGNFTGIGVYLTSNFSDDAVEVISPIKGSPAEEAGIKTGDKVLKVDGVEYKAAELTELTNHIKGEEGTEVTLTIKRNEETFDLKVTRRSVHINYVASEMIENNIGYISISTFDEECARDFKVEYENILEKGAKSLIIDLRGNGGGLVDEALEIADFMCDKNQITLITVDKDGKEKITKAKKDAIIKMPVVVLTNKGSASASEILVAALKENNKAEIVGDKTYGKGVIQELIYLQNGGALKVTSSEYYTPNKNKINEVGIEPNYEVKYDYTVEDNDEQLDKAIEVLKEKMK